MFKVVLVEDEILIRENIRDHFPWIENQLLYSGEASDGETALQLIEDVRPQIVITDIKMSFLNGLELSKILIQQMPWIKIIIVTGHDEFELAQQALKIGVSDYLLKPIGLTDLQSSLQAVVKKIIDEEMYFKNIEKLKNEMEINRSYLKYNFLRNLLADALSLVEIYESAASLEINIKAPCYAVVIVRLYLSQELKNNHYKELIQAGAIIHTLQEEHILLVRQSLKEYFLIIEGVDSTGLQNDCYRIGQSLKAEVEQKCKVYLSVFIGSPKKHIKDVHYSYEEALQTSSLSYLFGPNNIIGLEDIKMVNPYHDALIPFERKSLSRFLRLGAQEEVEGFTAQHLERFSHFPKTLFFLMLVRFNIFYEIAQFLEEIGFYIFGDSQSKEIDVLMAECYDGFTAEQIAEQARNAIIFALDHRETRRAQKYDFLIEKAKNYILENFHKSALQLPDVAAHVNISAGHLSTIFNQETGLTYTDFVTKVRIENAKELLLSTNLRSSEIAYKVGYSDPHYFYNTFKKIVGLTSGAYRSQSSDFSSEEE